jgi:tyrosinase
MAIALRLSVNGTEDDAGRYLTWSPRPASLRVLDADGDPGPLTVRLTGPTVGDGGRIDLRLDAADPPSDHLDLALAVDGAPAPFTLSGRFGSPSRSVGDAPLQVWTRGPHPELIASFPLMVRVRKDADTLSAGERDRLLMALARLNDQGRGSFQAFRDTHRESTRAEAHGLDGFPPWHRAFVLDLERALQRIDPGVTLPYWRFDVPAPRLFSETYLGAPDPPSRLARLAASNPLRVWSTDGQPGVVRTPFFDPRRSGAHDRNGQAVRQEAVVTGFPGGYTRWRGPTEVNPHGSAHVSFSGYIRVIDTAARDPLFFLLHCNVDRLWAKWQWLHRRFDPDDPDTYWFAGQAGDPGSTRVGHNLSDSMWPWNGVRTAPRPSTAPRTPFPPSPVTGTPGAAPTVRSMVDYQGLHDAGAWLGFDYDDVPYEP